MAPASIGCTMLNSCIFCPGAPVANFSEKKKKQNLRALSIQDQTESCWLHGDGIELRAFQDENKRNSGKYQDGDGIELTAFQVENKRNSGKYQDSPLKEIKIYDILDERTSFSTISSILKECGKAKSLSAGKFVHSFIRQHRHFDQDRFLGNCLVDMYGNIGAVREACEVFHSLSSYNAHSWNIMINAYVKNGCNKEALCLFNEMLGKGFTPDYCTFICTLNACTCVERLSEVQDIHCVIVEYGCVGETEAGTALVSAYGRCGELSGAKVVFNGMPEHSVISWNAMITACIQNGHSREGLCVFRQMNDRNVHEPDTVTFTSALDACTDVIDLAEGQKIHAMIIEKAHTKDTTSMTALVNMYAKCGSFISAKVSFFQISRRDMICWNTLISACNSNEDWEMALNASFEMQSEGIHPNQITFAYMLEACARLALQTQGQMIHSEIICREFEADLVLATALLTMYGKCGAISDAMDVFNEMSHHDVISWSAIITACAQNGLSEEALSLFDEMQRDGMRPDDTTFLSILSACSHAGWVALGMYYFVSMYEKHNIPYRIEHYTCMVHLLGRAGHMDDAEYLISTIPSENKTAAWLCFLGSCVIHGYRLKAIQAANQVFELDSSVPTSYVMLSNVIYTEEKDALEELRDHQLV